MSYTTDIYLITCLTNLHAGSGDENYGIVDKQVQRDPASGIPVIHASSLKGALREYFEQNDYPAREETRTAKKKSHEVVKHIFGSHPQESDGKSTQGLYKFFSAHLLSIPVRSNQKPHYNASSTAIIKDFLSFCQHASGKIESQDQSTLESLVKSTEGPKIITSDAAQGTGDVVEGKAVSRKTMGAQEIKILEKYIGEAPIIYNDADFEEIKTDLPVIARNHLENGISQNLWYEEIVPRQSRFYFAVMKPAKDEHNSTFDEVLTGKDGSAVIQIGANATVGYGYCTIKKVSK